MDGHAVKILHGYGGNVNIVLGDLNLENVKSFSVHGEAGKLPEVTVTIRAKSVTYEDGNETVH